MIEIKRKVKLNDYQLAELNSNLLFINAYDLSLKYLYEIVPQWKEFFFDILNELLKVNGFIDDVQKEETLFDYLKNNWYNIIKENKLKIDIKDYTTLTDYISFEEWSCCNNNFLIKDGLDFYLITIE